MKTHFIHNRVFGSLKQMMADMVDVFADLKNDTISSLCRCSYLEL